jgi:hypothetical protein
MSLPGGGKITSEDSTFCYAAGAWTYSCKHILPSSINNSGVFCTGAATAFFHVDKKDAMDVIKALSGKYSKVKIMHDAASGKLMAKVQKVTSTFSYHNLLLMPNSFFTGGDKGQEININMTLLLSAIKAGVFDFSIHASFRDRVIICGEKDNIKFLIATLVDDCFWIY